MLPGGPRREYNHAFSPDGRSIAYDAHWNGGWESEDGGWELWLMDADGGNRRRLKRNGVNDTLNVDGSGRRRLTFWTANPD